MIKGNEFILGIEKMTMKKYFKRFWIVGLIITVMTFGIGGFFVLKNIKRVSSNSIGMTNNHGNRINREDTIKFTHQIFDPAKVKFIVPLGELNGGYNESQTINGICIFNKSAEAVEVYAPADMTLKYYSYMKDPREGIANYQLTFTINKDVELTFHHLTAVNDELKAIVTPTENSGGVPPSKSYSIKAGQLLAKTTGTFGHNWNIYLSDRKHTNQFVNQERYEKIRDRYSFISSICPFDYYDDVTKKLYLDLMGATAPGQSATCGNTSKDIKGSISGLWHLTKENSNSTFIGEYQGNYATPFSIYKNSAGEIILYEIGRKRYILGSSNPSAKEPAMVKDSHCYNLTEWPENKNTKGFAYFKLISDMEMQMSYNTSGSCPASFPTSFVTYYR